MYLYGGILGVHVESGCRRMQETTSSLVMEEAGCPPGYCQLYVNDFRIPIIMKLLRVGVLQRLLLMSIYLFFIVSSIVITCYSLLVDSVWYFLGFSFFIYIVCVFLILYNGRLFWWTIHYLRDITPFRIIHKSAQITHVDFASCSDKRSGRYLLSPRLLFIIRDFGHTCKHDGPAYTSPHFAAEDHVDHVPALICSAPFPCITQYLYRPRSSQWPSLKALGEIATLPGLLVGTGKKGSIDHDWQWRQSYSIQEFYLARDMPEWVKMAFRALKATMNSVKKRIEEEDSETETNILCSYRMKTVLLWFLEEEDTWRHMCPFRLMIQLLVRLGRHLDTGHLPHYFNSVCDLLDNVPDEELELTKKCVKVILNDPVDAMIKACAKSSRGLPITLGKTIDYWLSPKCFLASIHSEFKTAFVSARSREYIVWTR